MGNDMLSQEEINALLNNEIFELPPLERDALGEIGNIAFGSGATALSLLLSRRVELDTPTVEMAQMKKLIEEYPIPFLASEVDYIKGLKGTNLLMIKMHDAAVIADLMMGGDGTQPKKELNEMDVSAVGEALNQMIGKASTSMSSLFERRVEIAPPRTTVTSLENIDEISAQYSEMQLVVVIYFRLRIEELVDSKIMLIIPYEFAREMAQTLIQKNTQPKPTERVREQPRMTTAEKRQTGGEKMDTPSPNVRPVQFEVLNPVTAPQDPKNLNLLLDVSLEISVQLGSTHMRIKDILDLGIGSVIELDRLAGEFVDILVNGKLIAKGEVVVIDENFGVKITDIISPMERVNNLQ